MIRSAVYLVSLLLLSGGCSSFDSAYQEALKVTPSSGSIEGPWEGSWRSEMGHGGDRLRAIVTRTGPETWHVWFRARFWAIFEADQEVDMKSAGRSMSGEKDLGWLAGGVYHYEATIGPGQFKATYWSKYDRGKFDLTPSWSWGMGNNGQ